MELIVVVLLTSLIPPRMRSSCSSIWDIKLFLTCRKAVVGSDTVDVNCIDEEYDCLTVATSALLTVD